MNASTRRSQLIRYYTVERSDLPAGERATIKNRIVTASDNSILNDRQCVGKHWFLMDAGQRDICPYCGWKLTLRSKP